jgi:membrane protein
VLDLIPAATITVSIYGIFTNEAEVERQIEGLIEVFPESTVRTIESQIRPIADFSHAGLSVGVVVSIAVLVWTVSNATRALVRAVVIAYDQDELRSPLERRAGAILVTVGVIVTGIVALAIVAAIPAVLGRFDPTDAVVTFSNTRWLAVGLGMLGATSLLYRYAPPRRPETWLAVVPGAVLATVLWLVMSIAFSIYVSSFASYNETYGFLGAAVVLLLWFFLTAFSVVLGAELNEALTLHGA